MKFGCVAVRLEEICDQITDGKHGDCQDEADSGFYFLSCKDVTDGKLNYESARQITEADFHDTHRRTKLEASDILVTNSGTIGRMAIAPDNDLTRRTTFQKSVAILKPIRSRVEPSFLYYALHSDLRRLIEFAGGTAQKNLLLRDLRAFSIELPSLPTQRILAGILSAYDDLIENNTRRIQILERMVQAIYREWFVNFRFPGHAKVKLVASPLGKIPQGWQVKNLGDVVELAYGKALKAEQRVYGPYAVYGSSGVVGLHNEALVKAPGIIVGRKGNVGSVFWSDVDFYPIDTVYFVRSEVPLHYVFYNLNHQTFQNNDAAVPGLNRNAAYMKPFILPNSGTLAAFRNFAEPVFKQLRILSLKNANLRCTRDLLLPRLLSGQVELSTAEVSA